MTMNRTIILSIVAFRNGAADFADISAEYVHRFGAHQQYSTLRSLLHTLRYCIRANNGQLVTRLIEKSMKTTKQLKCFITVWCFR